MTNTDAKDVEPEITGLDLAIREFLTRTDAGETISTEEFLTRHSDVRQELQAFFENMEFVQRIAHTQAAFALHQVTLITIPKTGSSSNYEKLVRQRVTHFRC